MFSFQSSEHTPQRLAVKLTKAGQRSVKQGHPWVFSDSIAKINKEGKPGDLAIIFDTLKNDVIGIGLFDPQSPIRIKMLHHGGPKNIDRQFFQLQIDNAYALRVPLLKTDTNSFRLLFGENDGFPGLIADMYATVLVVKLYSEIWLPYLHDILDVLQKKTACETIVIRLSRQLQRSGSHQLSDGMVVYGKLDKDVVCFKEHGVVFSANVIKGHKTGYFLDHRYNRKRIGELAKGKSVLDVFSYAGGFSVHALAGGATSVTSLDISEQALEVAKENGQLNEHSGEHVTIAGDAFMVMDRLTSQGEKYDIVVIDPPSFAKSKTEVKGAKQKYFQLAGLGARLVRKGGILVLASCSSRVSSEEFFSSISEALSQDDRNWELLDTTFHDIDHPITFPEAAYLKCAYYRNN